MSETHGRTSLSMTWSKIGWGLEPAMHDGHDYLLTTGHVANPERDYENFRKTGANLVRSGLRTRFANPARGVYDFSEAIRQQRAAFESGAFVFWDLCHYDYPEWVEPWGEEYVAYLRDLAAAFADAMASEGFSNFGICPVNEIGLWAWVVDSTGAITGEMKNTMNPALPDDSYKGRWRDQNVKATMAASRAVHAKHPDLPFLVAEPCHRDFIGDFLSDLEREDGEEFKRLYIGLNVYPHTHFPESMDPVAYFVPVVGELRRRFPENEIIISETSTCLWNGLPDRESWLDKMLELMAASGIEHAIWYPALDYEAWEDATRINEHGGWGQDPERTEYFPLTDRVRAANGVPAAVPGASS